MAFEKDGLANGARAAFICECTAASCFHAVGCPPVSVNEHTENRGVSQWLRATSWPAIPAMSCIAGRTSG